MTVADIINEYNDLRENNVPDDRKIKWLRAVEKKVMVDILRKYDGERDSETKHNDMWVDGDGVLHLPPYMYVDEDMNLVIDSFEGIPVPKMTLNLASFFYMNGDGTITMGEMADDDFGMASELSIPDPYTDIYLHYLDLKIAFYNNDSKTYNIASQEFNNEYLAYQQLFNRTHTPDRPRGHLIRHEVL